MNKKDKKKLGELKIKYPGWGSILILSEYVTKKGFSRNKVMSLFREFVEKDDFDKEDKMEILNLFLMNNSKMTPQKVA